MDVDMIICGPRGATRKERPLLVAREDQPLLVRRKFFLVKVMHNYDDDKQQ